MTDPLTEAVARAERVDSNGISIDYLRARLKYFPETGKLFWNMCDMMPPAWNGRYANTEAFTTVSSDGYYSGSLNNKRYRAHRIAWAIYHGFMPGDQVDHIDHNKLNNSIGNLRIVSNALNAQNQSKPKNNTSGVVGVFLKRKSGRWQAEIRVAGKKLHLGSFANFNEAVSARWNAEIKYGFHQNHGLGA